MLKKIIVTKCLVVGLLFLLSIQNVASFAVSDEAIKMHDKQRELAEAVIDYALCNNKSTFPEFMKKLNENQLETLKNAFDNCCFAEFKIENGQLNLVVELRPIDLLCEAIRSNDLEFVKLIVENLEIDDINEGEYCGCGSPLWIACFSDCDDDIFKYLLSVGAIAKK